jgi:hypothetical protein
MPNNVLTGQIKITAPGAVAELNKLGVSINKTGAALKGMTRPSNDAAFALNNLGRVAQDAPFGFIGIQNNINPLLESFQRLKATTGTTGGALKALGGSLLGPAGLGFAVSALSSLFLVFGDRLFGMSKAAKAADEANAKLAQGLADDLVKLTSLVGVVQNVTTSTEDRNKALRALNQEYGPYLDALGKEEISLGNVASAYEAIVKQMIRQAVVKGLQDEIAKSVEKTAKAIIELQKATENKRLKDLNTTAVQDKVLEQQSRLDRAMQQSIGPIQDATGALQNREAALTGALRAETNAEKPMDRLTRELIAQLSPLLNLTNNFEDLGIKLDKLKKTGPILDAITKTKVLIEAQLFLPPDVPEFDRVVKLKAIIESFDVEKEFAQEELTKLFKGFAVPVVIKPVVDANKLLAIDQIMKGIGKTIADNLSGAFNTFLDAVASGANVFKSFGQFVKNVIKSIITDLIKAVALAGILSLLGLGGGANPANFLQSLGKIFGGARAGGGPVAGGKGYIVGENGPEWFMPNTSGAIIPNGGSFGQQAGIGAAGGNVVFTIAGNQLRGVLAVANQSANRLS